MAGNDRERRWREVREKGLRTWREGLGTKGKEDVN